MAAVKIFFDGGLRPEGMEIATVCRGIARVQPGLGPGTSMDAEWHALIAALERGRALGLTDLILVGDAAAVIAQARGTVRARGGNAAHLARFDALAGDRAGLRLRHVKRAQNLAGIALERRRG